MAIPASSMIVAGRRDDRDIPAPSAPESANVIPIADTTSAATARRHMPNDR
jgi:hypothetical protein